MPSWVQQGCDDYLKRLPRDWQLQIREVAQARLGKQADAVSTRRDEANRILAALPDRNKSGRTQLIALDVQGRSYSTEKLAENLQDWQLDGRDIALLIGGPDGLDEGLLQQVEQRWSLSTLTLPHPLVRIILLEQLYRAWSILHNHPYHRAG